MDQDKQNTDKNQSLYDNEDYDLKLWERKTKVDHVEVWYEQPNYYLNEEESFCVLSFNQRRFFENQGKKLESEQSVDIFFDIKEEVIEFMENLLKKLKDNLINPNDYKLESEKEIKKI